MQVYRKLYTYDLISPKTVGPTSSIGTPVPPSECTSSTRRLLKNIEISTSLLYSRIIKESTAGANIVSEIVHIINSFFRRRVSAASRFLYNAIRRALLRSQ